VQRIEAGTANPGIDVICRVREARAAFWDEMLRGALAKLKRLRDLPARLPKALNCQWDDLLKGL
jgi:hypothetical protein